MNKLVIDYYMVGAEGRLIQENILIANELLDTRLKSGEPGVLYKLDFTKAFDRVYCKFLDYILEIFGFGEKWREWMKTCCYLAYFLILVNGSPSSHFTSTEGLQQGDHLSMMLFVLVVEGLTRLVLKTQSLGLLEGF